jgi:ribonuclease BN (tRNA processing enzyme)
LSTTVTFVGSAPVIPDVGQDTACLLLNGRYLVDCGWHAALEMRRYGASPLDLEALFITHCHHDHVMGLPMLLFYRAMGRGDGARPLRVYGPEEELAEALDNTQRFLRVNRFPEVWPEIEIFPLQPGMTVSEGAYNLKVGRAQHPVPALSYRFEDPETGSVVAFTGDTAYKPDLAELFRGADLLIHEASLGPGRGPSKDHSSPEDAARIALDSGVRRLALIHYPRSHGEAYLKAAQAVFPETFLSEEGLTLEI